MGRPRLWLWMKAAVLGERPGSFAGRECLQMAVGTCGEVRLVCRDRGEGFRAKTSHL